MPQRLYRVLEVEPDALADEVKRAYRRLALKLHPDKNRDDPEADARFQELTLAYSVLGDPDKRAKYDAGVPLDRLDEEPAMHAFDMRDVFASLFSGFQGFPGTTIEVPVSLADVLNGGKVRHIVQDAAECGSCGGTGGRTPEDVIRCMTCEGRGSVVQVLGPFAVTSMMCPSCRGAGHAVRNACRGCNGSGRTSQEAVVTVPRGVRNGALLPIAGFPGLVARVRFVDEGGAAVDPGTHDVTITLPLDLAEVMCGFRKEVTVAGETHVVHADSFFDPDRARTLPGLGLPTSPTGPRGDLHVRFAVKYGAVDARRMAKYRDALRRIFSPEDK